MTDIKNKKIPDKLVEHIRSEAEKMEYGRIIININKTAPGVDVVTEKRQRFEKTGRKGNFREG